MIVLGIDSSTDRLSIGLADKDRIITEQTLEAAQEHASRIIDLIEAVLAQAEITKEKLEGVAIADGPGSFTGLRIGMSAAKGLAVALKIPIVGVSSFEVVGRRLLRDYPEFYLAAMVRKGEMYLCRVGHEVDIRKSIITADQAEIPEKCGSLPIGIVGREPDGWADILPNRIPADKTIVSGGELAQKGVQLISTGKTADPAGLEPLYIAPSQAERKFGRR